MADNELLLALSIMMDKKLKPIKNRIKHTEALIEDKVLPRLNTIQSCFASTSGISKNSIEDYEAIK